VLVWWIVWLWRDGPGSTGLAPAEVETPALASPLPLQAELPDDEPDASLDFPT
jgi:hypothetical protein